MADIRPATFPSSPNTKPYRHGEKLLYQACSGLPSHWFALYEVHWVASAGGPPEGECDFVFIAPEIGLVVVEVKGGGVGLDANGWYSIDKNRERHWIKNPAQQAQTGRHALLDYLRQGRRPLLPGGRCSAHMVCFPNIQKSGLPPLPELSPKLIIDCDDLARLAESLTTGSQFFYREHGSVTLSQADCRAIADALKPVFEVPSRWSSHIFEQRFEIERLTAEQQSAFEMFKHNTRISLSGPAGSGKTVVAAHVARQVVRRRQTVLVVVPTKPLRQFYRSIICSDLAAVVLPDAAASALTRRFDLVLIDEAQDAPPDLWHSIRAYCDDVSAALLVVHDSNQRLATQWSEIFGRFAQATFTKVLRSTSQIGELAGRFYLNSRLPAEIAGPTGEPVKEIAIATSTDIPIAVSKFIKDLVQRESFSFRDFIVLFGKSNGTFLRAGGQTIGGLKFRNAAEVWGEGCDDALCIACGGITTFRGMESPVVVLCEVDNLLDEQLIEGCYVGISRAQHVLAIVGLPGTLDRIRSIDLGPVAAERRKHTARAFERHRAAERVANHVSIGASCLGTVTAVFRYGVFFRLDEFKCPALLPREEITLDRSLDLDALYRQGQEVAVIVRAIQGDKVNLALPPTSRHGRGVR